MKEELLNEWRSKFLGKEFTVIEKFETTDIAKVGDVIVIESIYPSKKSDIDCYFYGHNKRNRLNFNLKSLYFLSRVREKI